MSKIMNRRRGYANDYRKWHMKVLSEGRQSISSSLSGECTFKMDAITSLDSSSSGVVSDQSSVTTATPMCPMTTKESPADSPTMSVHWGDTMVHTYEKDDSCFDTASEAESWTIEPDRAKYPSVIQSAKQYDSSLIYQQENDNCVIDIDVDNIGTRSPLFVQRLTNETNIHDSTSSPISEAITTSTNSLDYGPVHPYLRNSLVKSSTSGMQRSNSLRAASSRVLKDISLSSRLSTSSESSCTKQFVQPLVSVKRDIPASSSSTSSGCSVSSGGHAAERFFFQHTRRKGCLPVHVKHGQSNVYHPTSPKRQYVAENNSMFALLSNHLLARVFEHLSPADLCRCARVCKRWYSAAWDPTLWSSIRMDMCPEVVDVDSAIRTVTKILSYATYPVCLSVERIVITGQTKFSDKGLKTIAQRCPELRYLDVRNCPNITNMAMLELVSKCVNLEVLIAAGCNQISCISLTPEAERQIPSPTGHRIFLRYLDLSKCPRLDDAGLCMLAGHCSELTHIFLRSCPLIGDQGVSYLARYCPLLREVSLNRCPKVGDNGIIELAEKLGNTLRYLSVAKCEQITDIGVCFVAEHCPRLRYINLRDCPSISDTSVESLARHCFSSLRSVDLGGCDISDDGVIALGRSCSQLVRVSLRGCDAVTDRGLIDLTRGNRGLKAINIQDCAVTQHGYLTLLDSCQSCTVEHSNPAIL